MRRRIRIALGFLPSLILFCGLASVYGRLCFPLLCAVLTHEAGHFCLLCGRASLKPAPSGFVLRAKAQLSYRRELAVALAGPLFNLLCGLVSLLLSIPLFAFFNFAYGLCSLLPLPRLDGGRMLSCLLQLALPPYAADAVYRYLSLFFVCATLFASLWFLLFDGWYLGLFPWLVTLLPELTGLFEEKRE